jgi:hypothetical protein
MFGNWLNGIDKDIKARIRMGVSAICWEIWHCRNNIIFNKQSVLTFCRLFVWLRTRYILVLYPPGGSARASGYWLQLTSIFGLLDGDILIESPMDRSLLIIIFRWLILVLTLANP